jgi:cobalt/nickel transport system ATP-binding protein
MSHHIVELKDVHFQYPDGTEALKGITFRIVHGESVGIAGANGMGRLPFS